MCVYPCACARTLQTDRPRVLGVSVGVSIGVFEVFFAGEYSIAARANALLAFVLIAMPSVATSPTFPHK